MTIKGGIATLKGVRYEVQAVIYEIPELLEGRLLTIRYQPASSSMSENQPPRGIFVDDYTTQNQKGQKCFFQAKQNTQDASWTINRLLNEGVIQQFWKQNLEDPGSDFVFVSNIPSPQLQNLADQARQTISPDEFQHILNQQMIKDANRIIQTLYITWQDLWRLLSCVNHHLLTEDQIQKRILDFTSGRYCDPDKFAWALKEMIEAFPGRSFTRDFVIRYLEGYGLFRLLTSLPQDIKTILRQASGPLRSYKADILGVNIPREETAKLKQWIEAEQEEHPVAFLLDIAGSGKSVILHDLLEELEAQAIPVLALKTDLLSNATDANTLQRALNLPVPPELLLATAAQEGRAVLLIDQLDALSLTFTQNQECLDTIISMIGRALTIPGIRIIVSCRTFDRKFDPKLRQIRSTNEFTIKPLEEWQIQLVLNLLDIKWEHLTWRERQLLSTPLHLDLFAKVVQESNTRGILRRPVGTIQDLYDALWEITILRPNSTSVSSAELQKAIYILVDAIHRSQELCQPIALLDNFPEARNYLESQGLLRPDGNSLTFFHQSFFDYCYARRFISQNVSLGETIRRGEQGFFVRSQIVQTLSYLRGTDMPRYLRELKILMDKNPVHEWLRQLNMRPGMLRRFLFAGVMRVVGPPVRYHLRHLVFAWFGQQSDLTEEEKAIGLSCLKYPIERRLFLLGARGNAEWFRVLQPRMATLFSLPDKTLDEEIIPFLRSVQEACSDDVFDVLLKQLGISDSWNNRVIWCLNSYRGWQSAAAEKALLWLCHQGPDPWHHLGLALHYLAKTNPALGCEALKNILDRLYVRWQEKKRPPDDGDRLETETLNNDVNDEVAAIKASFEYMHAFDKYARELLPTHLYWLKDLIDQAAKVCPNKLLDTLLPWLEQVLPYLTWHSQKEGWLRDQLFTSHFTHPFDGPDSMIIQGAYLALLRLADYSRAQFLLLADRLKSSLYLVFHQILAEILTKYADRYASWACHYLLEDRLRFQIGDLGSGTLFSRKLIGAIFPYLSPEERILLEDAVLSYYPAWENKAENLRWRGSDQLELLWEVPDELLTPTGRAKREMHRRKFIGYKPPERQSFEVMAVGSPIPEEKTRILSDEAWLEAMRYFNDETGWDRPRERLLKGDIIELSRALEKVVEGDPDRFARLALRFDESISSKYFHALLEGLAKSSLPSPIIFALCENFAKMRPDDTTVQRAICDVIEKRVKDKVPEQLIGLIRDIALTSADPEQESWQTKAPGGQYYYDGDLHFNGINTIRGRAVRVYVQCMLEASSPDAESLLSTLEKIATDPSSAVRSCLIEMLPYLLRFDSKRVVSIFETAVSGLPELLTCDVTYNFIYYTLGQRGPEMLKHIKAMRHSDKNEAHEACGRLATLCYFSEPKTAKSLYRQCLWGDASSRRGVAKVLARNVDQPRLLKQCLAGLRKLYNDSDQSIRKAVGEVFRYLPPPTPLIKKFIIGFLHSRSIIDAADDILKYAASIQWEAPQLALLIAELTQVSIGKDIVDIQKSAALVEDDIVNLAIAVHTHSRAALLRVRALDLFERVMDLGSHRAIEALKVADR